MNLKDVSKRNPELITGKTYMISVPGLKRKQPMEMKLLRQNRDMFMFSIDKTDLKTIYGHEIHLLRTTCDGFWRVWEPTYDYDTFETRKLFE